MLSVNRLIPRIAVIPGKNRPTTIKKRPTLRTAPAFYHNS